MAKSDNVGVELNLMRISLDNMFVLLSFCNVRIDLIQQLNDFVTHDVNPSCCARMLCEWLPSFGITLLQRQDADM